MTGTTIKVTTELRDRLRVQADAHERTLAGELGALLDEAERQQRYAAVRAAMAAVPPDEEYLTAAGEWADERWM